MFRFPFEKRWKWYAKNRWTHVIVGIEKHLDRFAEPYCTYLHQRSHAMKRWILARVILLVLLSASIVAAVAAGIARALPAVAAAADGVETLFSILSAFSGLFTLGFFFVNRVLGQLEADIMVCLSLGVTEP